ncbi:predicted protein [Sclerotinia sclerotiorum 1980 UF-70]|uniref:Uncharacterized protein n=1 Tax=Sclerotinia sclerotiorum (strain ATCC 18683 / 1980 / Ss-1) TaxID=665079 RepID=A7ECY1_SCLS1|nr:predicted protein [Sclerotinia sclerotiorum 1980 UF-70]EDO00697.1 predicted protein [Sclerotinia sclerotiorum 1980 UF-70]
MASEWKQSVRHPSHSQVSGSFVCTAGIRFTGAGNLAEHLAVGYMCFAESRQWTNCTVVSSVRRHRRGVPSLATR